MPDLLIELFSEEIPARMQSKAAADLKRLMTDGLVEAGLTYEGAVAHATPRRLALSVQGLTAESPTTTEERRGPRVDAPEKAIEGFLRSTGLAREDLTEVEEKKGTFLMARITKPGRPAAEIVAEVLERTIRDFPWPKSMRWGAGSLRWVRPLRRILCILTDEEGARVVPLTVDRIEAGDVTEGHRFMAPGAFSVASFDDYEAKLKRGHVILSAEERAEAIWQEATNRAFAAGLEVVEDKSLLAEVAGLVEWPVVLMGRIGEAFLSLPPEVLRTSMKEHQKFFSVRDKAGRIVRFVTVANRETADDGALILDGNSRVLSARLADAAFFWENDLRVARAGMGEWLEKLSSVTFHAKLGSVADQIERIAALAREIAPSVGADPDQAERAARLAKADLASEMVYEFPELQGIMGRYYALEAGEADEVADAARGHRAPLGPSDDVPTEPVSVAVALADKLDTLTGFWAIDEKPTGSKDPYALRRAALGVIRVVLEKQLRFGPPLRDLIFMHSAKSVGRLMADQSFDGVHEAFELLANKIDDELLANFADRAEEIIQERAGIHAPPTQRRTDVKRGIQLADDLLSFLHDRLKVHLREEGVRHDVIDACLTGDRTDDLADLVARARALNAFLATPEGENLVQGYRRAKNILTQAEEADGVEYSYGGEAKLAETEEERALFAALEEAQPRIDAALKAEEYETAMSGLAHLRAPIDAFFEAVQVNAENQVVRRNRLNLLSQIVRTCESIADLSRVEA
ncbi:glycine--tRNA ligase subunit beta [Jannaschia aquimarina]|uniref:Glycine--tRNA ligase beta subunit n=1 Tax=Jannaschia aquimarina TaxID=935700 RepID=A0A0D1DB73_9RHOB|nr:glycine--tRNA ligase subunit beta [Jannaschia aquimarina]KIT17198.1 Glycine--tRNA ligase beta subunit [Jannaschia aquimarina]SNT18265.1 glycyl-tRNA synthetase beta chain [Jannaschia aquimarina]